jgi:hypothetical protein
MNTSLTPGSKDAALDPVLAKDQDRQAQPEQDAGLQVVPLRWDTHLRVVPLLFRGAGLADAAEAAVLLERADPAPPVRAAWSEADGLATTILAACL